MSTTYRGKVERADTRGLYVSVSNLGGATYGPLEVMTDSIEYQRGDRVIVQQVGDVAEDLIVIGRVGRYSAPPPPVSDVPTGVLYPYGGTTLPSGYLWCDGGEYSRTEEANLFAVIGVMYGEGDGTTTFNVPDMRGRVPVGYSVSDPDFNENGKKIGAKTHTLTVAEMPSHNHGGSTGSDGGGNTGSGGGGTTGGSGTLTTSSNTLDWRWYPNTGSGNRGATPGAGSANQETMPYSSHNHTIPSHTHSIPNHTHSIPNHTHSVSSQGGGQAHNIVQPSIVTQYIIKT